jgi:hypothetical protein
VSLPKRRMLVVPAGTWKVGTGVGMAVEGVGISLLTVPEMVALGGKKAIVGTNWGRLVGVAEGRGVLVGVVVRVGVLLGVGEGPGVSVPGLVGTAVLVAGRLVLVGDISAVDWMATAVGIRVGVDSPNEAVT